MDAVIFRVTLDNRHSAMGNGLADRPAHIPRQPPRAVKFVAFASADHVAVATVALPEAGSTAAIARQGVPVVALLDAGADIPITTASLVACVKAVVCIHRIGVVALLNSDKSESIATAG